MIEKKLILFSMLAFSIKHCDNCTFRILDFKTSPSCTRPNMV